MDWSDSALFDRTGVGGAGESRTFTIDPTKKPRTLDLDGGTSLTLCIYELKGKELWIARGDDQNRPPGFSGKGVTVEKYK